MEFMKKLFSAAAVVILILSSGGCGGELTNSVTVKNTATNNVYLNAFGRVLTITPGQTQIVRNVQKGDYTYETSYDIPSGVTGTSAEGAISGSMTLGPSTKITIYYSSRIQQEAGSSGSAQSSYILIATVSSSDRSSTGSTSP